MGRRLVPWILIAALTAGLTAFSVAHSLRQYHALASGWSWDLAYYNQWFWSLTRGDGQITVRPVSAYAQEGPWIGKMNYLAPIRFLLAPVYSLFPDPRTLLIIQGVLFWWIIPAAFTLVRSECGSDAVAFSAAAAIPLTPLLWPLAWNDFRELQLAMPFVLWAVQGIRGRNVPLAAFGVAMMLACRQEFAVMVATFAFLPAREPEDLTRTLNWRLALFSLGIAWFLFGFFGYLRFVVGPGAPDQFINEFLGPKAGFGETLGTAAEYLWFGVGFWAVLALLAPRVAILSLPWVWSLCNGRWALRFLGTGDWHHVRYAAIPTIAVIAAGLIGYAALSKLLLRQTRSGWVAVVLWSLAFLGCFPGLVNLPWMMSRIPPPILQEEVEPIWEWVDRVGPEDGVLAAYELTAPLSSRRRLFSYVMEQNKPPGFPKLGPEIRWVFIKRRAISPQIFSDQGFELVHDGPQVAIFRRAPATPGGDAQVRTESD